MPRSLARWSRTATRTARTAAWSMGSMSISVKRRASAVSDSRFAWYSSAVVAPMQAISPRASAGLSDSARSRTVGEASRWISSKKTTTDGWLTSTSKSPRRGGSAVMPAASDSRGTSNSRTSRSGSGTAPGRDPEGQALDDGRLARAGRAQQQRVALRLAQEDLDDRVELPLAPHDGAQLAVPGQADEVATEAGQRGRRRGARGPHDGRRDGVVAVHGRRRPPRARGRRPARGGRWPCPGIVGWRSSGRRSRAGRRARRPRP